MKEITGDIWRYHRSGEWVAITTNGDVRRDGHAVMGRGIALQAAQKFPDLPVDLGKRITREGNNVFVLEDYHLISFPVKHSWRDPRADLDLIERSAQQLLFFVNMMKDINQVFLVRPGCGVGNLSWTQVRPILQRLFDHRFIICELRK